MRVFGISHPRYPLLPAYYPAKGPGDGVRGAMAGWGCEGGRAPLHALNPIINTLKAQEPTSPERASYKALIRPSKAL